LVHVYDVLIIVLALLHFKEFIEKDYFKSENKITKRIDNMTKYMTFPCLTMSSVSKRQICAR